MANRIFLLEDDVSLSEIIKEYLEGSSYEVVLSDNYKDALNIAFEKSFDILLLVVKVPLGDGFSLLKELRSSGVVTPAIFLTSLNSIEDVTKGYSVRCDDYIKKPFELKELLLRIKTVLKRNFIHKNSQKITIDENIVFDIDSQKLYKNNTEVHLSQKETKLLKLLLQNENKIVLQETIFDNLWDFEEEPSALSLRAYIKNLRKAIGKEKIESIRGAGYRYTK